MSKMFIHDLVEDLHRLKKEVKQMALDFTKIEAEVAANTTAIQQAVSLLGQLSAEIKLLSQNSSDVQTQAELDKLSGEIDAGNVSLMQAIAANTPTTPPATT